MTETMSISRRGLLQRTGALVVSFSLLPKLAWAQSSLPTYRSLENNPLLDSWIRINADGTVTVFTGKAELGTGIKTALSQIAAEELDVDFERVEIVTADTARTPDEGYTAGSGTMEQSGTAILHAAADARHILLGMAAAELDVPIKSLRVADGAIQAEGGAKTSYWDLIGGRLFRRVASRQGTPKQPESYNIVGQRIRRVDIPGKATGGVSFVQDLRLPGMLHARVVRPPSYGASLVSVDDSQARRIPGVVNIVRDGRYLAVIAEREEQAIKAADVLRAGAAWDERPTLPPQDRLYAYFLDSPTRDSLIVEGSGTDDPIPPIEAPAAAAQTISATYYRPYHMHGSIGPSCGVAQLIDGRLTIWSHGQGMFPLRSALSDLLAIPEERIRAIHMEGSGCYGHNGADDAAADAAVLAVAVPGRPVRVQWMREDEHTWEPYGSAMIMKNQASLDADGSVIDWNYDVWSSSHGMRPGDDAPSSGLIAAWHREFPMPSFPNEPSDGRHSSGHRNADPLYAFPKRRIVKHYVEGMPLRVSSTRGLGAYANVFAVESFMDELAEAAGVDPVEFRLRNLEDPRARAVIEAAAEKAGWTPGQGGNGHGRGIAFAQYKNIKAYAAIVMDVEVSSTGEIKLVRGVIAGDSGQIVNPDGLENQLVGGLVQAASWTMKEQVDFDRTRITSRDWLSYPILTFPEVPEVEVVLIDRPGQPYLGSGEATQGPTPAAIANAVYNAAGVRLREIPFTPDRVKAALST